LEEMYCVGLKLSVIEGVSR